MLGRGRKSKQTEMELDSVDDVDRLLDAVRVVNEAWSRMPRSVSLWIDWKGRKIIVQTKDVKAESHSRDSLRDELERRQDFGPEQK